MACPALVAIGRHDGEFGEIGQRSGERRETLSLVAVIIAKQYLHAVLSQQLYSGTAAGHANRVMTKKISKNINSEDVALFRDAVAGARPVTHRKADLRPRPPAARAAFRRRDEALVLRESLSMNPEAFDLETGEELTFRRSGVPATVFTRLRRGRFAIKAEIDLHGMTSAQARTELRSFLAESVTARLQCVRVIHGKGLRSGPRGPVLKASVNRWLRQWDDVIAFVSAPARDGGTGAVYVLLQR